VLRREGLYSSHIVEWRRARDAGSLAALAAPRGRKRRDPQAEQIARLQAEKQQLERELAKTRLVVDVQAKLHALLETLAESADTDPRSTPITDQLAVPAPMSVTPPRWARSSPPEPAAARRRTDPHPQVAFPTTPAPTDHRTRTNPAGHGHTRGPCSATAPPHADAPETPPLACLPLSGLRTK